MNSMEENSDLIPTFIRECVITRFSNAGCRVFTDLFHILQPLRLGLFKTIQEFVV